jgi:hypothetical protein
VAIAGPLPIHETIDGASRGVVSLLRQMAVDECGRHGLVAEILLQQPESDSGFEEMRRIRMPQRVHRDALFETESSDHPAQRVLQAPRIHRTRGGRPLIAGMAEEGEEPHGIAVRLPIGAKTSER